MGKNREQHKTPQTYLRRTIHSIQKDQLYIWYIWI